MANISNPQQTERVWMEAMDRESKAFSAHVNGIFAANRALSPQEIQGIIDYAQRSVQYYAQYVPVAAELARMGYPKLQGRLDFVRKDLDEAVQIYTQMMSSAMQHQAYRNQIMAQTNAYVTNTILQSTAYSQKMFDQSMQMQRYVDHGMPFGMAEFLAKMPK